MDGFTNRSSAIFGSQNKNVECKKLFRHNPTRVLGETWRGAYRYILLIILEKNKKKSNFQNRS